MSKSVHREGQKTGFTLIEVILFLAITGALFTAIAGSIFASIHTQRYRDTTKDLSEFFRRAYSAVGNVENPREKADTMNTFCSITSMWEGGTLHYDNPVSNMTATDKDNPGRSNCVIYGKLITWGENDEKDLYMYDIIGRIYNGKVFTDLSSLMSFSNPLRQVYADVVSVRGTGQCTLEPAGTSEKYTPQWEGWLEDENGNLAKGAVIIFRSPVSGTIETYYLPRDAAGNMQTIEVQKKITAATNPKVSCSSTAALQQFRHYSNEMLYVKLNEFKQGDTFVCINSGDRRGQVRALKLKDNGNNASAVELTEDEESRSHCRR